ncbi:hypothetical protein [Streptomyces clavuligerus]|uniref:Thiazole biosynthesis/tRNA modification protein ThiI n=1 Tax=Streptomyces clavuligerus TaxID=1901 RepID=D5SHW6_STRCL|nr:hypothetical protein [Streptomyces clavuligerus]EFG03509.1 Thiazole biosynthesis/tRNA modification protein ThiI [Streptomyces clavuligerus]
MPAGGPHRLGTGRADRCRSPGDRRQPKIIDEARRVGTADISTLPDEDCCSLLAPPRAGTRAELPRLRSVERRIDLDEVVEALLDSLQTMAPGTGETAHHRASSGPRHPGSHRRLTTCRRPGAVSRARLVAGQRARLRPAGGPSAPAAGEVRRRRRGGGSVCCGRAVR